MMCTISTYLKQFFRNDWENDIKKCTQDILCQVIKVLEVKLSLFESLFSGMLVAVRSGRVQPFRMLTPSAMDSYHCGDPRYQNQPLRAV